MELFSGEEEVSSRSSVEAESSGSQEREENPHGEDDSAASASKSDNAKEAQSQTAPVRPDTQRRTFPPRRNSNGRQRRNHTQNKSKQLIRRRPGNRSVSRGANMRHLARNNPVSGHRHRRQFTRKRGRPPLSIGTNVAGFKRNLEIKRRTSSSRF